jgi:hypothetical protein
MIKNLTVDKGFFFFSIIHVDLKYVFGFEKDKK